jgi:hypothetical protein
LRKKRTGSGRASRDRAKTNPADDEKRDNGADAIRDGQENQISGAAGAIKLRGDVITDDDKGCDTAQRLDAREELRFH